MREPVPARRSVSPDSLAGAAAGLGAGAGVAATPGPTPYLMGLRLPPATPKSHLKQPERVVALDRRPAMPQELRQLLGDADAAAGAAAAARPASGSAASALRMGGPLLGSCATLTPVRARRTIQQALDAGEQVCEGCQRRLVGTTPLSHTDTPPPHTHTTHTHTHDGQVLTPVRRSARKTKAGGAFPAAPAASAFVQPMLEATNWCYQPNEALQ